MTTMTPYSGSLLKLAFTTVAILAVLAAAFSAWQGSGGFAMPRKAAPARPALGTRP